MIKMICGFLHSAPSLMTFYVITLCWSLGTTQCKVVSNDNVTACLTWYSAMQQAKVVIGVVMAYCNTVSLQMAAQSDVKSMQCDSVFVCEGFCTNRNLSPIGVGVWNIWNIIGEAVCVVPCFVSYLHHCHRGWVHSDYWHHLIDKQLECAQHCPEPTGVQKSACMLFTKEHGWWVSLSYGTQMHLTHSAHEGEQLLQCNLQGTKCLSHVTPETKKASMWKNASPPWEFQTNAISKEGHDSCLYGTIKVCIF
jgi:hypothetical protein